MTQQTDFTPPVAAQVNARRGLELRRRFPDGITKADIGRANAIAKGAKLPRTALLYIMNKTVAKAEGHGGGAPSSERIRQMMLGGAAAHNWAVTKLRVEDDEFSVNVEVSKVDKGLGIVFGYAIVCKVDDEPYFDTQGDHIPEDAMLEATSAFMTGFRVAKDMHQGGPVGQVVYGFPLTSEIAKSLGLDVAKTGFIVGMKPDSDDLLTKYANGDYTGFSIGGRRIEQKELSDDKV